MDLSNQNATGAFKHARRTIPDRIEGGNRNRNRFVKKIAEIFQ